MLRLSFLLSLITVVIEAHPARPSTCTKILLTLRMRPAAITLNYCNSIKNIWYDVQQIHEKLQYCTGHEATFCIQPVYTTVNLVYTYSRQSHPSCMPVMKVACQHNCHPLYSRCVCSSVLPGCLS